MSRGNTTCKGDSMSWSLNNRGETPCKVYEDMINLCQKFEMFDTQLPPTVFTCTTSNPGSCCCSSAAFALFQACMACQWGLTSVSRSQNFSSWLDGCDNPAIGSLPDNVRRNTTVSVPQWALVSPQRPDQVWNSTLALANATSQSSSSPTSTVSPSSSTSQAVSRTTRVTPPASSKSSLSSRSHSTATTSNGPSLTDPPPQPIQTYSETGEQLKGVERAGKTTGALIGALVGTALVSIILVYWYKQKGASIMGSRR